MRGTLRDFLGWYAMYAGISILYFVGTSSILLVSWLFAPWIIPYAVYFGVLYAIASIQESRGRTHISIPTALLVLLLLVQCGVVFLNHVHNSGGSVSTLLFPTTFGVQMGETVTMLFIVLIYLYVFLLMISSVYILATATVNGSIVPMSLGEKVKWMLVVVLLITPVAAHASIAYKGNQLQQEMAAFQEQYQDAINDPTEEKCLALTSTMTEANHPLPSIQENESRCWMEVTKATQNSAYCEFVLEKYHEMCFGLVETTNVHNSIWDESVLVGPQNQGGGTPYELSLWRLNIGPIEDRYTFYIDAYSPDIEIVPHLTFERFIDVRSDTLEDGIRRIVYTEGGMCGSLKGLLFREGETQYLLSGECIEGSNLESQFFKIFADLDPTSLQDYQAP